MRFKVGTGRLTITTSYYLWEEMKRDGFSWADMINLVRFGKLEGPPIDYLDKNSGEIYLVQDYYIRLANNRKLTNKTYPLVPDDRGVIYTTQL